METVTDALDALGLALAGHDHVWTARERQLYESAVAICDGCTATDWSASGKHLPLRPSHIPLPVSDRA
jgi:hypothetical protein